MMRAIKYSTNNTPSLYYHVSLRQAELPAPLRPIRQAAISSSARMLCACSVHAPVRPSVRPARSLPTKSVNASVMERGKQVWGQEVV